uniref:S-acyltransferase n=1 Tax=Glycine max TaxID=3847 RepID=A0A0R0EDZ5_SOYBN
MKGKRFLSVPVLAVFLLMLFVYYSSIFVFLQDWLGLQSSPGTLNAFLFSLFASLSLFSFFSCVLTDPGHVPSSYAPDVEFSKDNAEQKKCDKCFAYKPPRTHHCRVCRRCILKMDHHCLWINNCVGYWNYKAFFVFVFYATTIIFMSCVFQKDWDPIKGSSLKIFYCQCNNWHSSS